MPDLIYAIPYILKNTADFVYNADSSEQFVFWDIALCSFIPEAETLHNHRCENLKCYNGFTP
jgi:hypothetical protein